MLAEAKSRHSRQPISQEDYDAWRQNDVTKRMFEEIEIEVLEQALEEMDSVNLDELALNTAFNKGCESFARTTINWSPEGVRGPNDED